MANAELIAFDSTGPKRFRNRLGTDITADSPIQAGELANIRTSLLGTVAGLTFLGTIAGNSVPNQPAPNTAGGFYVIRSAGTSQTQTWGIGDYAIYLGTSGQWQRIPAYRDINVKDFGAAGDGATDDTAAIQAAIDQCAASGVNGTVILPPGIYKTTTTLTITATTRIIGSGYVGATAFGPDKWAGSMIRYSGTAGTAAIQVGDGTNNIFRVDFENLRIGTFGQSSRPHGLVLLNVSECVFRNVQINGGFAYGLHMKNATLCTFYNLVNEANQVALVMEDLNGNGSLSNTFLAANFYQNSIAHVKIIGNARNITFSQNCWFEDSPVSIWVPPPTLALQSLNNIVFDGVGFSHSANAGGRFLIIDGGSTANSLAIRGISFRDALLYMENDYAAEIILNANTGPNTYCRGIEFVDCKGYAVKTALVNSDFQNASLTVSGLSECFDAWGGGNAMPFTHGTGRFHFDLHTLAYRDFASASGAGEPWRLPQANPYTLVDGMFAYSSSQHRPFWSDGGSTFYLAGVDQNNRLLANRINAAGIPIFSNNAAAKAGGLVTGDCYRTGADPDPLCIVH